MAVAGRLILSYNHRWCDLISETSVMVPRFTVLLVAFALADCWNDSAIQGSGNMPTQTIAAAPFTALHVEAIAEVVIEGGAGSQGVSITADEKFVPYVVREVRDGTPTLSIKSGVSLQGVAVNAADALDASINGAGNIGYIGSPKITQNVSGSGKISPQQPQ